MYMKSLDRLHESMRRTEDHHGHPIELQCFRSVHGAIAFECIFFTAEDPYKLSMTSRGTRENPDSRFFVFDVSNEYEIASYLGDKYGSLANLLRTRDGASGTRFLPNEFLAALNANIPVEARLSAVPTPKQVIDSRPDITHERDRPYWSHWETPRSKSNGEPGRVSAANRKKTAALLGSAALEHSDRLNKSSHWSPVPTKHTWHPK